MASCCFTRNKLPKVPTNLSSHRLARQGKLQQVRAAARKKTQRAQPTFPPNRLARQGNPAGPGGSPKPGKGLTSLSTPPTRPAGQTQQVRAAARKTPKGLTSPSAQPTRPAGQQVRGGSPQKPERPNQPFHPTDSPGRARLTGVPPAAAGGKKFQSSFPGHVPGKRFLSPRECRLRRRGSGCSPQFWEGPPTKQAT